MRCAPATTGRKEEKRTLARASGVLGFGMDVRGPEMDYVKARIPNFFLARRFRAETGRDWENNADAMSRQQKKSVEAK